ncbi:MAG: TolB-like 6-bladed beta-propeller domain-containing protein [Prevotellaceae bacterium]|jgi:hypothetical protein|nr:TolB-like 6-bladed beta-propeller domain-containing protein [Prevotellaceae bacterium]
MNRYILVFCVLLCSCGKNKTAESFFGKEHKLYGETLSIDCLIGKPAEIVCIDSLIIFYDFYEGQAITVLDVNNNRLLSVGQGPEDIILPLKLSVSGTGNRLNVFQMQNARCYEYEIKDIVDTLQTHISRKYQFEDRPANIAATSSGFVGIGIYEEGRYKLYDENGKTTGNMGKYPFRGEKMDPVERFFIYQGALRSSPNGNHFVMGTHYCDNLEFYTVKKDAVSLTKKYETYDVKGRYAQRIILDDDCVMSYKGVYGTDQYCYMLYSGERYGERNVRTTGGKKIIVFDWNGVYIKTFEVDTTVFSFCVDKTDSVLFGITYDENEGFLITRYDIKS